MDSEGCVPDAEMRMLSFHRDHQNCFSLTDNFANSSATWLTSFTLRQISGMGDFGQTA